MLQPTFNFARDVVDTLATEIRTGLIFIDEFGHRRDYGFGEIAAQSARYAAVLRAFGIGPGDRVALCTSNTAKCIFTLLALERLGAVRVPCMEDWDDERITQRVRDSNATALISNRKRRGQADSLREAMPAVTRYILIGEEHEGWARVDTLASRARPFYAEDGGAGDPPLILDGRTHGSRELVDAMEYVRASAGVMETDRVWCTAPMGCAEWIAGVLLVPWSCGAATVLHEGAFHAHERLDLVRELDVTILIQPAQEYDALCALEHLERFRAPRLRRCIALGKTVERAGRWHDALHVPIETGAAGLRLLP